MEYIYGSAVLLAALIAIAAFRAIFDRRALTHGNDEFMAAGAAALVITALASLGIAFMISKIMRDWSLVSAAELAVALGVVIAAAVIGGRLASGFFHPAAANQADPTHPVTPRPGRPSGAAGRKSDRPKQKRAA